MPREAVLCLADENDDLLIQLAAALAVGSAAVWPSSPESESLRLALPPKVRDSIVVAQDWRAPTVQFDAVLHHGNSNSLQTVCAQVAARTGAIIGVRGLEPGATDIPLESLVIERALSVNTAAAGGNATLMTIV